MENMTRLTDAIKDYIMENGQEYQRLLLSKSFYETLKKEADEHDSKVDLPRIEIKENADYDFKLLP